MLSTSTTFSLLFQLVSATVKDGHGTGERATSNIALKKGNVKQSSRMTTNTSKSIRQSKVKNDSSDDEDGKMDAHTARWIEEAAWKKLFLPSLYHALFISEKPFLDFQLDSPKFLMIVQDVFDLAYPNDTVVLRATDGIVKLVCLSPFLYLQCLDVSLTHYYYTIKITLGKPLSEQEKVKVG
jgi:hypothetical protein